MAGIMSFCSHSRQVRASVRRPATPALGRTATTIARRIASDAEDTGEPRNDSVRTPTASVPPALAEARRATTFTED